MTDDAREAVFDRIEAFRKRRPRLDTDVVTMAHGAGGKASAALVESVFLPRFANPRLGALEDGAVLSTDGDDLVLTTDSFVVNPWRFPGGSVGDLAINGTVNDLAMMGARPRWLAAAFVLEEGLAIDDLRRVVDDMAEAAQVAGVEIVAGDTKVVGHGEADGLYVTTSGVGTRSTDRRLGAELVRSGDAVLVTGEIGDHGMAIMLARGSLALDADIRSDTASLAGLVEAVLDAAPDTRWMRDATRGGVASSLNELAAATDLGIVLDESAVPVAPATAGACELLGIDPLYVANEGRAVVVVPADRADAALDAMRRHPLGEGASIMGEVVDEPAGLVVLRTPFGGTRIVDLLVGDPLPRIC